MKRRLLFLGALAVLVVLVAACGPKKVTHVLPPEPPILPPPETVAVKPPEPTPPAVPPEVVKPKAVPTLQAIHFDFDKYDIRPGDAQTLEADAAFMKDNTGSFTLEGYCDPVGTEEYNRGLGLRRANSARDYLVKLGIDRARLSVLSFGEEKLLTEDEAQFELNRRVEFVQK